MLTYKKILFPVDLTEASEKVFPHVKTMADKFQAGLLIIYVASEEEYFVESDGQPGESIKKKAESYREKNFPDVPPGNFIVVDGEPADEILKCIEKENVDVVIMAIRGRRALDKAIFGSVSANVARSSSVPVLFVNPHRDKFTR